MNIALVGDSHAQVLWPKVKSALTAAGHTVTLTEANPGWSEAKYLSSGNLSEKLSAAKPNMVVYGLGGNNQKMSASSYLPDVRALVSLARDAGASVILYVGPATATETSTSARHETTADILAANLPALRVEWLDSRPLTLTGHRSDGVHFTSDAYTTWASAIANRAKRLASSPGALSRRVVSVPTWVWLVSGIPVVLIATAVALRFRRKR